MYTYEHAYYVEKPSSELHTLSYARACEACLAEIEKGHGVDWKVTEVTFEDLGRETQTRDRWPNGRVWKCTHKVRAQYNVEHRIAVTDSEKYVASGLKITYKMLNEFYSA